MSHAKFALGHVVATPGAIAALEEAGQGPAHFLDLHRSSAWGDLDAADRQSNDAAIAHEGDLLRIAQPLGRQV